MVGWRAVNLYTVLQLWFSWRVCSVQCL